MMTRSSFFVCAGRRRQQFGNNFLTKFEGSVVDAPILRNITLVDTPGERENNGRVVGMTQTTSNLCFLPPFSSNFRFRDRHKSTLFSLDAIRGRRGFAAVLIHMRLGLS